MKQPEDDLDFEKLTAMLKAMPKRSWRERQKDDWERQKDEYRRLWNLETLDEILIGLGLLIGFAGLLFGAELVCSELGLEPEVGFWHWIGRILVFVIFLGMPVYSYVRCAKKGSK